MNMKKLSRKAWNKIFKEEGMVFNKPQEDIPRIVKLFKKHSVKRILDLGCGTGRHLIYLAKHKFDTYGIDNSEYGLKFAKHWLEKEGLKANLKVGNIYNKLPYKSNFFDAVISTQTMHHGNIAEIRKLMKEIERILRPKGFIFITVRKRSSRKGIKYIASRTYIHLEGREKNLPHYQFNKNILKREFRDFKIIDLWIESTRRHYCLLATKEI